MGADSRCYVLHRDKQGMTWDLLLYVPTVLILASIGLKLWFGPDRHWTYLLLFMASFFFIQGSMRILKTRLLLFPGAPVKLSLAKQRVKLQLRNGDEVELVRELRYFPDYAGKSIALTGIDLNGRKLQYILHRGQFSSDAEFKDLKGFLEPYK
jgi:hypothetical protein